MARISRQIKLAFYSHRAAARKKGINFLLTLNEWLAVWEASGRLQERGRNKGQYVMARFGDKGPYAIGNVRICTVTENHHEAHCGKALTKQHKENLSKAHKGRRLTLEQRAKLSKAHKGKRLTTAHRENIGKASKGDNNPNAKLTRQQVEQLRRLRTRYKIGIIELGKIFGVSKSTAWNVVTGAHYTQ